MKLRKLRQQRIRLMAAAVNNQLWQRRIDAIMAKWYEQDKPWRAALHQEWAENLLNSLQHFTEPACVQSLLDAKTEHDRKLAQLLEPVDQD